MEQVAFQFERLIYTVSDLNGAIRGLLDREFADIWVSGEISGVKNAASGHCYFTLKDAKSQIRCVAFRSSLRYFKFKPQEGVAVLARGRIDVYDARGEYQLLVEMLEPQGHGALQFAFEQLKKKLDSEGLFDSVRKRPLPRFPRRIGIVTSPRGAVIADMLHVLSRRFPGLHIRLFPALVQGEGSVAEVCRGLQYFSEQPWAEVVIVARGGGSLEDLWTFNDEAVARAIAACAVPVISAVGHEIDFTIADFVADLRAPTPSAAAELVVRTRQELLDRIAESQRRIEQYARYRLALLARLLRERGIGRAEGLLHRAIGRRMQRVDELQYRLRERSLLALGTRNRRRLEAARSTAVHTMRLALSARSSRLGALQGKLSQLSPLRVLDRGYAIVTNEGGTIVKSPADAPAESALQIRLSRGNIRARVT
ncbi:MAG: exodeoxyribonuclease VII large subunit [Bryobacteraceae bacterium]